MIIKFSRHAKRRAELYDISEGIIVDIMKGINLENGKHKIVREVPGFKYPLKIIVAVEGELLTVITNYPLKKRGGI